MEIILDALENYCLISFRSLVFAVSRTV